MIPKIIHYCWFGRNPLPRDVKKCIASWKVKCPDYEIIQWNEDNFDININPFVKSAYDAKAWAFVSDYARLKVVYDYGGIYLDTDVELLKNLDFLLKYKCYIGVQQVEHLCSTGLGFGAVKSNPVVHDMLKMYEGLIFDNTHRQKIACPYLNDHVIHNQGYSYEPTCPIELNGLLVLPEKYMDPIAPGDGMEDLLCEETISIHHYSASWMGTRTKWRRKIIIMIGQRKINKLKQYLKR